MQQTFGLNGSPGQAGRGHYEQKRRSQQAIGHHTSGNLHLMTWVADRFCFHKQFMLHSGS